MPSSESLSTHRGPAVLRGALYVMRGVLNQVSGLAGILAFLAEMWNRAPIDEAVYSGAVVGGSVYLILLLVDVALEQIILAEQRNRLREQKEDAEKEEIEVDSATDESRADSSSSPPDSDRDSGESASSGDASTSGSSSSDSSSENKQLATV